MGKNFITPLISVLQKISRDEMGREALKARFERVVLQNTSENFNSEKAIRFDGKNIVLDHGFANAGAHEERASAWVDLLERNL